MTLSPDEVFERMDAVKRSGVRRTEQPHMRPEQMQNSAVPSESVREPVYIPGNTRNGTYRQLMRSHDRMGTRHLQ